MSDLVRFLAIGAIWAAIVILFWEVVLNPLDRWLTKRDLERKKRRGEW